MSKPIDQERDNQQIAQALRACDWSNVPIGNKAILQAACAALEKPAGVAVPEGWKLVPVSPTHEMDLAGIGTHLIGKAQEEGPCHWQWSYYGEIYRAMLAAAPLPVSVPESMRSAAAAEMNRLGYGHHESHAESILIAAGALRPVSGDQKAVAVVDEGDDGQWADILPDVSVKVGDKLYAAPPAAQDVAGLVDVMDDACEWFELRGLHELNIYKDLKRHCAALAAHRAQQRRPAEETPWIEHGPSTANPFTHPYSSKVDVRLRDGTEKIGDLACNFTWFWYGHDPRDYDVVAYRAHRAQQGEQPS